VQDPGGVIRVTHVRKERRVGAYRAAVITILDSRLWRERGRVEVKHTEDREHSELADIPQTTVMIPRMASGFWLLLFFVIFLASISI